MAKMTIQDIAKVLVAKNNLPQAEAEAFVSAIFDVVETGIAKDKLVKIKGLGAFKVVNVDARESVNVNTGERVVIDSHDKITFTPDAMMKELVNKPFSSFETVVLNEGVEFDDTPAQEVTDQTEEATTTDDAVTTDTEQDKKIEAEAIEESNQSSEEAVPVQEEELPAQEEEVLTPEATILAPSQKDVAPTDEKPATVSIEENSHEENIYQEDTPHQTSWWKWLVVAIVCTGIGFAAGFYTRPYLTLYLSDSPKQDETETKANAETPALKKTAVDTLSVEPEQTPVVADTVETDSAKQVFATESATVSVATPDSVTKVQPKKEDVDYLKYDDMDVRVKTGAYYIIGTQSVVQAREGDNVAKVSRRYLGEGMSCYVEVYNGMSASTPLQAGQEIKIPKIIMKKTLKMRLEQQKNKNQQ